MSMPMQTTGRLTLAAHVAAHRRTCTSLPGLQEMAGETPWSTSQSSRVRMPGAPVETPAMDRQTSCLLAGRMDGDLLHCRLHRGLDRVPQVGSF